MHASVLYDVAGALISMGVSLIIPTLIISVIEAVVMLLLKWDKFGQSLRVSLLMNVASTVFGIGGVLASSLIGPINFIIENSIWLAVAIAFLLTILIEVGILIWAKQGAKRLNWLVGLIANIVSYLLVILPLVWLNAD